MAHAWDQSLNLDLQERLFKMDMLSVPSVTSVLETE